MYKELEAEIKNFYMNAWEMTQSECMKEDKKIENKILKAYEKDEITEEEFYTLMALGNYE